MTHADRDRSELHAYLAADKADYPRTWKGDGYARAEAAEAKVAELTEKARAAMATLLARNAELDAKVARFEALAGALEVLGKLPIEKRPDGLTASILACEALAGDLRAALAGDAEPDVSETQHTGGNGEDCPICRTKNLPYPFLCGGDA